MERKIKICQLGKDEKKVMGQELQWVSLGKSGQGRVNRLGLAGMNNFSRLWASGGLQLFGTWPWDHWWWWWFSC